jgi:hypothetical protein
MQINQSKSHLGDDEYPGEMGMGKNTSHRRCPKESQRRINQKKCEQNNLREIHQPNC